MLSREAGKDDLNANVIIRAALQKRSMWRSRGRHAELGERGLIQLVDEHELAVNLSCWPHNDAADLSIDAVLARARPKMSHYQYGNCWSPDQR